MATQVSKLNYVDAKLGGPTGGQQTTRYIYDSVVRLVLVTLMLLSSRISLAKRSSKQI
jgi:hypothetical protein